MHARVVVPLISVLLVPSLALALELPTRRAGLWTQTLTGNGEPSTTRMCVDPATDKKLQQQQTSIAASADKVFGGGFGIKCSEQPLRMDNGAYVIESSCQDKRGVQTHRTELRGDFNAKITVNLTAKHTPPNKDKDQSLVGTSVWSGACPAGWKPGEMSINGGERVDVIRITEMAEGLTKSLGNLLGR